MHGPMPVSVPAVVTVAGRTLMRRSWGGMRAESRLEKKKQQIKISAQHRALRERESKIDGWDDRHLAGLWERRTFHREHVWEGRDSGGGEERERERERSHTNSEANWSIPLLRSTEPCSSFHPEPKTHTHTHSLCSWYHPSFRLN